MVLSTLPVIGLLLNFIYKVGEWVEGFFIMLFTALAGLGMLLLHFLRAFFSFLYPPHFVAHISALGERLEQLGKRSWVRGTKIAVVLAGSITNHFSYWAAGLAVAGVLTFSVVAQFYTIGINMTVNGQQIAVVSKESDFTDTVDTVERGLTSTLGENYAMASMFSSRFCVVKRSSLTSGDDLYNNVYGVITAEIGDHYGVYVDGTLIAAADKKETIEKILNEVKAPYIKGTEGETVDFVKNVDIRCGLYPASQVMSEDQLRALFSTSANPMYYTIADKDYLSDILEKTGVSKATLYSLNPGLDDTKLIPGKKLLISQPDVYLGVQVTRDVTYTENISYSTTRIKDDSLSVNQTKVKTEGKNGEKTITAKVVYVDGVKQSSDIITSEVTKAPVAKEIYVGTKAKSYSSGSSSSSSSIYRYVSSAAASSSVGKGSFIRPIDGGYISCGFGGYSGHTGTDFTYRSGAYGKPVYASAAGTVVYAQASGSGYGNMIKIDHGNGLVTYYAHLSSIGVKVGQTVSQGQYIGAIGATGRTTGPHVHFEIRINGVAVNAMNYLS